MEQQGVYKTVRKGAGFEKQTYTQVPNSLFEIMHDMDECELKVVLYICRYTFGYHRDEVKISTRKLAKAINMSVASVDKGADAAVQRGLIERITDGQNTTLWRAIVSDSEIESPESDSENEAPMSQKLNHPDSDNESQVGVKESIKEKTKQHPRLSQKALDRGTKRLMLIERMQAAGINPVLKGTHGKDWASVLAEIEKHEQVGMSFDTWAKWWDGGDGFNRPKIQQIARDPRQITTCWYTAFRNGNGKKPDSVPEPDWMAEMQRRAQNV